MILLHLYKTLQQWKMFRLIRLFVAVDFEKKQYILSIKLLYSMIVTEVNIKQKKRLKVNERMYIFAVMLCFCRIYVILFACRKLNSKM